ncbi:MAG: hypothetical protein M1840_003199 [Geoglossum simile]|nr:MAG: hypothetical protein M1840_003199 [Geoglossum simile]
MVRALPDLITSARPTLTNIALVVLPLANSPGGHRLGVNGLAIDSDQSVLYSGGRDGVICSWNLNLDLNRSFADAHGPGESPSDSTDSPPSDTTSKAASASTFRAQVQAHTHWVNDIVLTQDYTALVSCSSDLTVKVWRPHAEDGHTPETIGLHSDYVKCLAAPNAQSDWVASGGLDRKIRLWDLNRGEELLEINVGDEGSDKGSIYALGLKGGILASGGPESVVRVWDPRTGKRITKFVGHTDNIRAILINRAGDTIMTASSDTTVKVWSVTGGRCLHTLSMHNDSVWSLYSDHPDLSVFYSSDRSGLVAKTDVRNTVDMDEGICVAVCQEHEGVGKVISCGRYIWTATSSSSINRWLDVDMETDKQIPEWLRPQRASSTASRPRLPSSPQSATPPTANGDLKRQIPMSAILRVSNTSAFPAANIRDPDAVTVYSMRPLRKPPAVTDSDASVPVPVNGLPDESIEGQNGLIKHIMLNDRRRVLTLDTAGEVVMWDILKVECIPVKSYGKCHLEDIEPTVNASESFSNWCTVDTRTGRLACVLEENYCFDAETYADELDLEETIDFREDQRINHGKWVLRYLFSGLIDEEIRRDSIYRKSLMGDTDQRERFQRSNAPPSIQLPSAASLWQDPSIRPGSPITPKAINGHNYPPMTPGMAIGVATPGLTSPTQPTPLDGHLLPTAEEEPESDKPSSSYSQSRSSGDYFSSSPTPHPLTPLLGGHLDKTPQSPSDTEKESHSKESSSLFGKKFRYSFGGKKLGRSPSVDTKQPVVVDEKAEDSDESKSMEVKTDLAQDNLLGVIEKIRQGYNAQIQDTSGQGVVTAITPSMPNETPVLKPPPNTTVIIQEDRPDSGGAADLYRGTVGSLHEDADLLERVVPTWLGDLLLLNQVPFKETSKVSFVLQPWGDLLPSIANNEGNSRLNANRMLRSKKILVYVAERIEAHPEKPDPNALKPEEYLELYCQNQIVPPTMTLATLRAHVWKSGTDVLLYYKSNGRKEILGEKTPEKVLEEKARAVAEEEEGD